MTTERDPAAHQAWLALAMEALESGATEVAVERAKRAVELDRRDPASLNHLGVAHAEHGNYAAAEQAFRRALKLKPAYAAGHHNLAKALQRQGRLEEARREFERAQRLDPRNPSLQLSLCGIHRLLGEPERALAVLRAAAPHPSHVPQMADCIADVQGADAALEWLRARVAEQPDNREARFALGALELSVGNWRDGWRHYAQRTERDIPRLPPRLDGTRVALQGEQGLGDMLFYLRFAAELAARGAAVAIELPPPLARLSPLLAGRFGVSSPGDTQVWAADLPHALESEATPPPIALEAEPERIAAMREQLARLGPPPYLGLTWRAGTTLRREIGVDTRILAKEIPAALLEKALQGWPGTIVRLQRDAAPGEPHDLDAVHEDLRYALALLALLDEYVGVSNTNMHLRAGLGRTARVLVPSPPEWRWMRAPGGSPWFPGFSVYRQPPSLDWSAPLAQLRRDLSLS